MSSGSTSRSRHQRGGPISRLSATGDGRSPALTRLLCWTGRLAAYVHVATPLAAYCHLMTPMSHTPEQHRLLSVQNCPLTPQHLPMPEYRPPLIRPAAILAGGTRLIGRDAA